MSRSQAATEEQPTIEEVAPERASEALGRELKGWVDRRVAMGARIEAIDAEHASIDGKLVKARLAAIAGDEGGTTAIAGFLARQQALDAERIELAARIGVAAEAEHDAQVRHRAAKDAEREHLALSRAVGLVEQARTVDVELDGAVRTLRDLLASRHAIATEAMAMRDAGYRTVADVVADALWDVRRIQVLDEQDPRPRITIDRKWG